MQNISEGMQKLLTASPQKTGNEDNTQKEATPTQEGDDAGPHADGFDGHERQKSKTIAGQSQRSDCSVKAELPTSFQTFSHVRM